MDLGKIVSRYHLKNVLSLLTVDSLYLAKNFFLLFYIGRYFTPTEVAVWSQHKTVANILYLVTTFCIFESIVRYFSEKKQHRQVGSDFWGIVAFCTLLCGAVAIPFFLFSDQISFYVFKKQNDFLIITLGVFVLFESLNFIYNSFFISRLKFNFLNFSKSLEIVLDISAAIAVYSLNLPFKWLLIMILGSRTLSFLLKNIFVLYLVGLQRPSFKNLKKYLKFAYPLFLLSLSLILHLHIDKFIVLHFLDIKQLGIYAFISSIGYIIALVLTPIDNIYYPMFAKNSGKKNLGLTVAQCLNLMFLIGAPLILFVSFFYDDVLRAFSYQSEYDYGFGFLFLILVNNFIFQIGVVYKRILVVSDRSKKLLLNYLGVTITSIVLCVTLIQHLQLYGVLIAIFVSNSLFLFLNFYAARDLLDLYFDKSFIGPVVGAVAIAAGTGYWLDQKIHFLINMPLSLAVFGAGFVTLKMLPKKIKS